MAKKRYDPTGRLLSGIDPNTTDKDPDFVPEVPKKFKLRKFGNNLPKWRAQLNGVKAAQTKRKNDGTP